MKLGLQMLVAAAVAILVPGQARGEVPAATDPAPSVDIAVAPVAIQMTKSDPALSTALDERVLAMLGVSLGATRLEAGSCVDTACWAAAAVGIEAQHLVELRITASGPDQRVELVATDVRNDRVVVELEHVCELCGRDELVDLAGDMAATAARRLAGQEALDATLRVSSVPSGATVIVDDEVVGTTPFAGTLSVGKHALQVELEGYRSTKRTLNVTGGGIQDIDLSLAKTMPPPGPGASPEATARKSWVIGGASAVAVGIAAVAGGAVLLALHHRPITRDCGGNNVDADGDCLWLHETRGAGIGTLAGGVAAVAAGAVVLGLEFSRRGRAGRTRASISPSGLQLSGRF